MKKSEMAILIKSKRKDRGLTQRELSVLLGYDSPQFLSNIERGVNKPPVGILAKICEALALNKDEVIKILVREYQESLIKEMIESRGRNIVPGKKK